ncbi:MULTISPECIES: hypothetical protein [Salipiger]|mgnify:CR=1 FL=1|uniref:hypothetical protein n=1 Tax=Salipiger TaxID=263377 RepID=UPI001999A23C|nr:MULTISPECIES: hypothetical protein [Salipiger]GGA25276.1 hypothetical protein GCM10011326_41920 [Salipiger profundus]
MLRSVVGAVAANMMLVPCLFTVYEGGGHPPLFNIGPQADPSPCLVEQAVNARLDATLAEAEARLLAQFAAITVEEVAQDFERRFEESGHTVPFPWHGATGE